MSEGSVMELGVVIKAIDYFTGPLRSMISSVTAAEGKMASINNTMKLMGKSKSEIDAINASLNRMADQKAFANIASDLERVGMARQDIAAMETSYMRMAQYQRDMSEAQGKYAAGKDLAMSGVGSLTTAAIGGFGIAEMVKQAGEFQSNMATIQDTTGASNKQMNDFSNAIMNASTQVSKFNDFQMAQIAQTLTSGGFGNVAQAQSLLLPSAKFAEVQSYENKSSDPIESVKQAIEMAHVFKDYDPKSFQGFLDTFNKYSMMQPGDSSSLVQTLTYLAPKAQTLGMSQNDILGLSAVANRIGLTGSHGGTNAADMLLRLIPGIVGGGPTPIKNSKGKITGYKTPKAWAAMEELGFVDAKGNSPFFDKNGKIVNLNGMLTTMVNASKKLNPAQLTKAYHDIFGAQGGNAASILANPTTLEQLQKMRGQLSQTKGMDKIHSDHQATAAGQLNLLKSNSLTLMLRVGQQLAISLNPAIKNINTLLGKMLEFSQAHPQVAKLIGDFALFAVGGKAAEGVIKIFLGQFKMLSAAVRMFKLTTQAGELTRFGRILSGLKGTLSTVTTGIRLFARSFGSGLVSTLSKTGSVLKTIGSAGISAFKWVGGATLTGIRALGSGLKVFSSGALTVIKILGNFGLTLLKLGAQAARWAVGVAADWLIAMGPVGWIIAGVTALIAAGIIMWKTNFLGFRDGLKAVWNVVKSDAGAAWNGIKSAVTAVVNWFKNLPSQMMSIGRSIIEGLAKGITGAVGTVIGAVKSVGGTISSAFKSIMKINSPSKVFMAHGASIIEGLTMGIDRNAHLANKSTANLANGVTGAFRPNVRSSVSLGGGGIVIQSGAIVIQGGNDSADVIANKVLQALGKASRRNMMNAGTTVNMGAV